MDVRIEMRIWDVNPGYLHRSNLLGEHNELHALVSIFTKNLRGYRNHPETKRWENFLGALSVRHGILVAEMKFRGYRHSSPLDIKPDPSAWPGYIDPPYKQVEILKGKYGQGKVGRIPFPKDPQEAWAHHKFSILARDEGIYREMGRMVSRLKVGGLPDLLKELTELMRIPPKAGGIRNALEHMWGYISGYLETGERKLIEGDPAIAYEVIQKKSKENRIDYLLKSTAMGELSFWIEYVQL